MCPIGRTGAALLEKMTLSFSDLSDKLQKKSVSDELAEQLAQLPLLFFREFVQTSVHGPQAIAGSRAATSWPWDVK